MTDTPMKLIVNCETGEETYLPMTADEIAEMEARQAEHEQRMAELAVQEAAKLAAKQSAQEKLKKLGLSDAEIAAITGA